MFSKSVAELPATLSDRTFVIAAVSVVLPWSTCPMVPMSVSYTHLDVYKRQL